MSSIRMREYLRTHVLGLIAIFIALTGSAVAGSQVASSSKVTTAKFKKLKQKVANLDATLKSPVRGDLSGLFPDLRINDDAVTREKIADDAVNDAKLANDSVGSGELKSVVVKGNVATAVPNGTASGAIGANCAAGEQALGGGGFWSDWTTTGDGLAIGALSAGFGGAHTWLHAASNQSGASQNFTPQVICLAP
jgi:hypothetical protein